ncbi:hypothetical protein [Phytohabitans rumicis]|nr:hypothetical protein [Phytohabitans rumicis]
MSFKEVLREKVHELKGEALDAYAAELERRGLGFDADGELLSLPDSSYPGYALEYIQAERDAYRRFTQSLDELVTRFEGYYELSPHPFTVMRDKLGGRHEDEGHSWTPYGKVHRAADQWVGDVKVMIDWEDWAGDGAAAFLLTFIAPFETAAAQQMACLRELTVITESYRQAALKGQKDLINIARLGIAAFAAINPTSANTDPAAPGWGNTFSLFSIVLSAVGLTIATGGADIVIGGTSLAFSTVSTLMSVTEETDPGQMVVTGATAQDVVLSTWDALTEFDRRLADNDDVIRGALDTDLNSTTCYASPTLAREPNPGITIGDDTFRTMSVQSVPGTPIGRDKVVVSIMELYRAGYVDLPNAADLYQQARDVLYQLEIPFDQTFLAPTSYPLFNTARDRLRDVFTYVENDLRYVATALIEAADCYHLTDEQGAEVIRQKDLLVPPAGPHVPGIVSGIS